jgi:hypothetical protein
MKLDFIGYIGNMAHTKHENPEKRKRAELIRLLKEGEDSGMIEDFHPAKFLAALHEKYKEG